jgi:hypothetical protein
MITHRVSQAGYGVQEHSPEEVRAAILAAEGVMRQLPQVEIEPTHVFAQGLYSRSILIPKGVRITGKVHRQDDLQIMVYGDITILTPDGFKRLVGHHVFRGKAGVKQIGHAHEDTLWITVHAAVETDLDRLEEVLYEDEGNVLDFKTGRAADERVDYYRMLAEVGISHETAWAQSQITADRRDVDLPGVTLGPSRIHGTGVFAAQSFWPGDPIGLARIDGMRTQLGRYTNHSHTPNAQMHLAAGQIELKALALIREGEEIITDYRETLALSEIKGALCQA